MRAVARLAAFVAVLALLSGGAALAGGAIDPRGDDPPTRNDHTAAAGDDEVSTAAHSEQPTADPVRGLGVAAGDLRVVVDRPELRKGRTEELRFRIVDEHGRTVRDFDVEHEQRMHLILARRDLTGFQHLHPIQGRDGTWSAPVRLDDAGSYRLFADVSHDDTPQTLASDLRVDGDADLRPLPAPRSTAASDGGYDVRLDASGSDLRFAVEFPTPGRYRLFLQFKHEGRVHTAAFTREVA